MKTVMVFGATGSLGTYFVDHLVEKKFHVWAIGNRNVNTEYYSKRKINCASINIVDTDDFKKLPSSGIDSVIHISGAMPSRMEGYKPQLYIDVNLTGTLNILEYCRRIGVSKYLFTQSHSDVAGFWNTGQLIKPDSERKLNLKGDHAVYIITKNAAVDLIKHYHLDYGLKFFILRLPTVYHYRPSYEMFVNGKEVPIGYMTFIKKAINSEPIEIWGDPTRAKDIVYVKDFNQLLTKALESDVKMGFYNVGTGVATTLEDQVKGVIEIFSPKNNPSPIIYRPEKPSQNSYLYDIQNAKDELGYNPEYLYLDMLKDMKEEMKAKRFDHLINSEVKI